MTRFHFCTFIGCLRVFRLEVERYRADYLLAFTIKLSIPRIKTLHPPNTSNRFPLGQIRKCIGNMRFSLESPKRLYKGFYRGVLTIGHIKGNTLSLDYSSYVSILGGGDFHESHKSP